MQDGFKEATQSVVHACRLAGEVIARLVYFSHEVINRSEDLVYSLFFGHAKSPSGPSLYHQGAR